jgi:putative DNA primase/helicase
MDDSSKFAPLTEDELAGATEADQPDNDGSELISPAPSDAPEPPRFHPTLGALTHSWRYLDGAGATLQVVYRFDPAGKRKLFLLRRDARGLHWRWKGLRAPLPLYGLDKRAAHPNARVVICEGEKATDAAQIVFPESVCVTSCGGAAAANMSDWTPLAGRACLISPDADSPGADYAHEVAERLTELRCEVSIVDAMALASLAPGGGARAPQKGWDMADAVGEWEDIVALRDAAQRLATSFHFGPRYLSYGPYAMTKDGLEVETTRGRGAARETARESVSGPFEILGKSSNPSGGDWGLQLRWRDSDGRLHQRLMPSAALHVDPAAFCQNLAAEGLQIQRSKQRALADYLNGADVRARVARVERTGWHSIGGQEVFVLPEESIKRCGAETVVLDTVASAQYETRGNITDWRDGVGMLSRGHAVPVLAISAALAGPLLRLAGGEGGGLHFFGQSSKGKTTILQAEIGRAHV